VRALVLAEVYAAARRLWIGTLQDPTAATNDAALVRVWARWMWSNPPEDDARLVLWVISQAATDGHE